MGLRSYHKDRAIEVKFSGRNVKQCKEVAPCLNGNCFAKGELHTELHGMVIASRHGKHFRASLSSKSSPRIAPFYISPLISLLDSLFRDTTCKKILTQIIDSKSKISDKAIASVASSFNVLLPPPSEPP